MSRTTLALIATLFVSATLLAQAPDVILGPYVYDGAGDIRDIGTEHFAYDRDMRLVRAVIAPGQQTYTYDAFGNRTDATTSVGAQCNGGADCGLALHIDGETNHILLADGASYDDAGNLAQFDGHTYTYDPLGMMTSQTVSSAVQYIYTADDERIAVYGGGRWKWSLRDQQSHVIRQFTSDDASSAPASDHWTWITDDVFAGTRLLASERDPLGRRHFHLDHLGTPRLITDDHGAIVASYEYYPFGTQPDTGGTHENPTEELKFTGHQRDLAERDVHVLDYMHARYYDGSEGRFLSVDPVLGNPNTPQSWNRYAYVRNSPIGSSDPTGKVTKCDPQNCTTTADTYNQAHSTGQTTVATPDMRTAATAGANKAAVHIGTRETLGYGVRDANGNLTVKMAVTSPGNTTANSSGATASTKVPSGAEFAIHGHIDGGSSHSNGMVDAPALNGGYGDTQSLALKNPIPMATVSHGQVGWHEIQNGQLSFTAPVGAVTPSQQQAIQRNLDSEQKLSAFWKP